MTRDEYIALISKIHDQFSSVGLHAGLLADHRVTGRLLEKVVQIVRCSSPLALESELASR